MKRCSRRLHMDWQGGEGNGAEKNERPIGHPSGADVICCKACKAADCQRFIG